MLIQYLSKFPLLGEINLDYKHWCEVLSNKNNSKGGACLLRTENLNMHTQNRNNILGNNLSYIPNLNISNKRNLSTSSKLQGKIKSNKYLFTSTELVV